MYALDIYLRQVFDHQFGLSQAGEVAVASDGDATHSGGMGGLNTGNGIFDYQTILWVDTEFLCGFEEDIRGGFAAWHCLA